MEELECASVKETEHIKAQAQMDTHANVLSCLFCPPFLCVLAIDIY